jgi:FlaA1/EpsC-like NDP-sugar epimerase
MTIPEAASLVIQAGSMADGGDVFVLNMGEPIKIVDLARRMILLMGFKERTEANPAGDIEIRFVGLRPGEKLYEELLIGDNVTGTTHPKIMHATERSLSPQVLGDILLRLQGAIDRADVEASRALLKEAVDEYRPGECAM